MNKRRRFKAKRRRAARTAWTYRNGTTLTFSGGGSGEPYVSLGGFTPIYIP